MDRCRHVLQLALCSSLLWPPLSLAQDQTVPQDNAARPQSPKEAKKREKKLSRELASQGGDWLRNIVPDIITEQERRAFLELGTEEEREQFKEIFWRDRNPDPDSPRLRRRTLCLRHSRPENRPRPHLHHLGPAR